MRDRTAGALSEESETSKASENEMSGWWGFLEIRPSRSTWWEPVLGREEKEYFLDGKNKITSSTATQKSKERQIWPGDVLLELKSTEQPALITMRQNPAGVGWIFNSGKHRKTKSAWKLKTGIWPARNELIGALSEKKKTSRSCESEEQNRTARTNCKNWYFIGINGFTNDPRRSPSSLPHLIENEKLDLVHDTLLF
jgi:hypothetical protein